MAEIKIGGSTYTIRPRSPEVEQGPPTTKVEPTPIANRDQPDRPDEPASGWQDQTRARDGGDFGPGSGYAVAAVERMVVHGLDAVRRMTPRTTAATTRRLETDADKRRSATEADKPGLPPNRSDRSPDPVPPLHVRPERKFNGRRAALSVIAAGAGLSVVALMVSSPWDTKAASTTGAVENVQDGVVPGSDGTQPTADASAPSTTDTAESSNSRTAAEYLPLGPIENLRIPDAEVTFTRPAAIDPDPSEGWQEGISYNDGLTDFSSNVTVNTSISIRDDGENPGIEINQSGTTKIVTINLNNIVYNVSIPPESYIDEYDGIPEEPVALLGKLIQNPVDPTFLQQLKDDGLVRPDATTLDELVLAMDNGIAYLIPRSNQIIVQELLMGSKRVEFFSNVKRAIIAAYGLDRDGIEYHFIDADSNANDDFATLIPQLPEGVLDDAMRFSEAPPHIEVHFDNTNPNN